MQYFRVDGENGTYVEFAGGEFCDTVSRDPMSLDIEATNELCQTGEAVSSPPCSIWTAEELEKYVGAE